MSSSKLPFILAVEDESAIATIIRYNLEREGFRVHTVELGQDALDAIKEHQPDLILLDWMLPDIPGVELCKKLRAEEETKGVPIIMLTARSEETDRVQGLDAGADDYIAKPFSPKELVARIRAVLRRLRPVFSSQKLEHGGVMIDLDGHRVTYHDKPIHLGPTEFRLLAHFIENPGRTFSRENLLNTVWGQDIYVELRTVDVHIRRLRKAMEECDASLADFIKTIRSAGYMVEK